MDTNRYINCMARKTSEGQLLLGDDATALFDCGMIFCADETIENVKTALRGRPLDYIFATHTHYDHIGALPFFRDEWPEVRFVTTDIGAAVLLKDTPRRVIRELSASAAELFRPEHIEACSKYDDNAFHADIIVRDGDNIPLGGLTVRVLETPGHTRDALSFFIPELKLLILSESTGGILGDRFHSYYLTSCDSTISSINKCRALPFEFISQAHNGIISPSETAGYFDRAEAAARDCRDFILSMHDKGMSEDEMIDAFTDKYLNRSLLDIQPETPFRINAKATIACTLRDF